MSGRVSWQRSGRSFRSRSVAVLATSGASECCTMKPRLSSKNDDQKPTVDGDPRPIVEIASTTLQAVSHKGRLVLDRVGDAGHQLTDTVTFERVSLKGQWELVFDDDTGAAALAGCDCDGQECMYLAVDLMRKGLYMDNRGERFIVYTNKQGATERISFDLHLTKYRDADVQLRLGDTSATASLIVFVMAQARSANMRVWWGLFDIYRLLNLNTFAGQPCKWVNAGLCKWRNWLLPHIGGSHTILSKHWNLSPQTVQELPWYDRCLPQTSISTILCLVCLCSWSCRPAAKGGMKSTSNKDAAATMLKALLSLSCSHVGGSACCVYINDTWQCNYPRPQEVFMDHPPARVQIQFEPPDVIDISSLFEAPHDQEEDPTWQRWLGVLMRAGVGLARARMPIFDLLAVATPLPQLQSLVHQLLWHLALRLEICLAHAKDGKNESGAVTFGWKTLAPDPGDPRMEEKLYNYVIAGIEESRKHDTFTVAVDKASPSFQSLANGVLTFPNGVSVLCCPQVVLSWLARPPQSSEFLSV